MFTCKKCDQRDRLIAAQEAQIKFLQNLVAPPASIPLVSLEADAVLSGNQEIIEIEESSEAEDVISERARILSGNF